MARQTNMNKPIRSIRLGCVGSRRETLGDLTSESNARYYQDIVQAARDGAVEQRCGGGHRRIIKRTPE